LYAQRDLALVRVLSVWENHTVSIGMVLLEGYTAQNRLDRGALLETKATICVYFCQRSRSHTRQG